MPEAVTPPSSADAAPATPTLKVGSDNFEALFQHYDQASEAEASASNATGQQSASTKAADSTAAASATSPSAAKETAPKEEKVTVSPQSEKAEFKVIKGRDGDKEITLPEDAVFFKKIDGKEVPVKLSEALNEFSGNAAIRQRFTEIDKEKKALLADKSNYQQQLTTVQDKFKQISELTLKGNPHLALEMIAEMAGRDPLEFTKEYLNTITQISQQWGSMTPEQKELFMTQRKAERLEQQMKSERERIEKAEGQRRYEAEMQQLRQQHQLSDEQISEYKDILSKSELFHGKEVKPSDVAEFHSNILHLQKVDSAISSIDPELTKNLQFVDQIATLTEPYPQLTAEDIAEFVKELRAESLKAQTSNLNQKVEAAQRSGNRIAPMPPSETAKPKEPTSWDDL